MQISGTAWGQYILEHPLTSRAWALPCIIELAARGMGERVDFDMCCFGMVASDEHGPGRVLKPTTVLTNAVPARDVLQQRCTRNHRHVQLVGNRRRTRQAAIYPIGLCDAFLRVVDIMKKAVCEKVPLHTLAAGADMCDPQDGLECVQDGTLVCEQCVREADVKAWRREEIRTFREIPVYEYATVHEYKADPTATLLDTTWVDDYGKKKSRLCAREFARDQRDDLFAATPPLMATKLLLSQCASEGGWGRRSREKGASLRLMALDVRRAFLYGRIQRSVYIKLPPEDPRSGEAGVLGRLLRTMYGTRDAPLVWHDEVSKMMLSLGFRALASSPCTYAHDERGVLVVAHVDDFLLCGERSQLEWVYGKLSETWELKRAVLGPGADESREITFLGRTITWSERGLLYSPSPKHVERLLERYDMSGSRAVVSPGVPHDTRDNVKHLEALDREVLGDQRLRAYREAAALLNYLGLDRADVSYAGKEVSRKMAAPTAADELRLKRVIRYLQGARRGVFHFPWQSATQTIRCQVDSDWAGCVRTRRSTSGGVLFMGAHCLAHWSRTQATVALSSGEAELNAALKGAAEAIGLEQVLRELGLTPEIVLEGDSSACKGTLAREGAGRQKHLEVRQLWLQEHVKSGRVKYRKIPRDINSADCLTKHWGPEAQVHFRRMGYTVRPA